VRPGADGPPDRPHEAGRKGRFTFVLGKQALDTWGGLGSEATRVAVVAVVALAAVVAVVKAIAHRP
jgi:hypothetical protein